MKGLLSVKGFIDRLGQCLVTVGITIAVIALLFKLFSGVPPASTDTWFIIGFIVAVLGGMTVALHPVARGITQDVVGLWSDFRNRSRPRS